MSKFKAIKRGAAIIGAGTGLGAVVGYSGAEPGRRSAGAKEGALTGAITAGTAMFVFRKIRGRIVRIKVKK